MAQFNGKTVVVLGASAQGGSGWVIAEAFAEQGANVVVGARRIDGVQTLANQINGVAVRCDAAVEDDVRAMAEAAQNAYGKIDVAILAAGTPVVGTIDSISSAELLQATSINYFGAFNFVKYMARHMNNDGAIVIISSLSSISAIPGYAAYAAAKGATSVLVKYAGLEYAPRGIRVNSILAGLIQSPMTETIRANQEAWNVMLKEIPLGRAVQPYEIAQACLWLSSPYAAMTGATLNIDNGNHLRRSPQPEEMPKGLYEQSAKSAGY